MCKHIFIYPQDTRENLNPDGMTLTGLCKCGATQVSHGMRWVIMRSDYARKEDPDYLSQLDKDIGM